MNGLNSLINEYFSITGRPISTMTVDEYIKFAEKASLGVMNTNSSRQVVETENKVEYIESRHVTPVNKKPEPVAIEKTGEKKRTNNALSLMQSISG